MIFRALLIAEDSKETELFSELVKEVVDCEVDQITKPELIGQFNYNLVLIEDSPKIDAVSWLERIKRISPAASVILVSDHATVEQAVTAMRMGAEDYFSKPVNIESLRLAVKRALDRKTVFEEDVGASSYLNLLHSCQLISGAIEQQKVFAILHGYFRRELRSQHSAIYQIVNGDPARVNESLSGEEAGMDRAMHEVIDISLAASNPLQKMADAGEFSRFIDRGSVTPGLFIFRFRCVGDVDFFFVSLSPERPTPLEEFESRLRLLKAQIEVSGKTIERYIGVQSLVYVDDATGLYNTRYLNTVLDREIQSHEATRRPFAVLFIDADKFKSVNDTHGHLIGTKLLNALGAQLKRYVRGSDTVFRYGGDEFVAVLSSCDLNTAQMVAERIRHSVENETFLKSEGVEVRFTVSIGVALFPDHAQSKKAIIEAADKAMYIAKKTSRNRVYIASDLMEVVPEPMKTELATEVKKELPKPKKVGKRGAR